MTHASPCTCVTSGASRHTFAKYLSELLAGSNIVMVMRPFGVDTQ
jgi:hypothetical protein